ncbi:protein of unknown function [Agreia sp. COWG]|nr:protein of unknown function [Agreia sp. COWG]
MTRNHTSHMLLYAKRLAEDYSRNQLERLPINSNLSEKQ